MYCIHSIRKAPPLPRRGSCPASVCEQTGEGRSILRRKKGPPVGGGREREKEEGGIPLFLSLYCILKLHPNHVVSGFCYSFKKMTYMRRKNAANRTLCQTLRCFCGTAACSIFEALLAQFFYFCGTFCSTFYVEILRCHKNAAISHEVSCLRRFFAS